MIKKNIFKCVDEEMLNPVQHDGKKGRHPETRLSHPELDSGSQMSRGILKQVQHDGRNDSHPASYRSHPEFISGSQKNKKILKQVQYDGEKGSLPETRLSHPEFISGSQEAKEILNPVQYDDNPTEKIPNPVQYDDPPTRQASNPAQNDGCRCMAQTSHHPQYDGWCRASLSLGRSMIEMLGVLAIIGVLSIGGLYAYRQAMESYKIAQTIDWIRQIQMIYLDTCMEQNSCPFMDAYDENGQVPGYADFNRAKLCQFNNQMCSARLPHFKEAAWYFYTLHGLTANIVLTGLPQSVCRRIVSTPWTSITGMQTQAVFADGTRQNIAKSSENGVMRPQDQKALMEICEKPAQRYNIWISFTSGG